jgi:hypothetical protein
VAHFWTAPPPTRGVQEGRPDSHSEVLSVCPQERVSQLPSGTRCSVPVLALPGPPGDGRVGHNQTRTNSNCNCKNAGNCTNIRSAGWHVTSIPSSCMMSWLYCIPVVQAPWQTTQLPKSLKYSHEKQHRREESHHRFGPYREEGVDSLWIAPSNLQTTKGQFAYDITYTVT